MSNRRHGNLVLFGALSLALHIVVLTGVLPESSVPTWRLGETYARDGEILVAIQDAGRIPSQGRAAPAPALSRATPAQPVASTGNRISDSIDDQADRRSAAVVLGEVRSRLTRYLAYPPLARARGWEGTVLVGFRLASDGQLEAIRVARSSGYDILDASALDSLGKVGRVDAPGKNGNERLQQLELAVMYRLEPR